MSIPIHENKYVKNCLNCGNEITDLKEEHLFCTQCGFPVRNECTGTSKFQNNYSNEPLSHDFNEEVFVLNPNDAFCPKCGSPSLFNTRNLINGKYPKVEIIEPESRKRIVDIDEDDIPF